MSVRKSHDGDWYILCDDCGMESDPYETRGEAKEDADAVGNLCAYCIDLRAKVARSGR